MEKEKDGVWRTIRGRRIFIGKGESLGEAMSKSGKFKRENLMRGKRDLRLEDRMSKYQKARNEYAKAEFGDKGKKHNYKKAYNKLSSREHEDLEYDYNYDNPTSINQRITNIDGKTRVERHFDNYSKAEQRELKHEELQKKLADYRNEKEIPSSEELFKAREKRARQNKEDRQNEKNTREKLVNDLLSKNKNLSDWDIEQEAMNKNLDKNKVIADYKAKKQSNNKIQNNNDEFDMRKYTIELQHDKGTKKIDTIASSKESAIKSVLKSENAPDSAVKSVKDNGSILNKQSNNKEETWEEKVKRLEKENAKNKNYEIPKESNNKQDYIQDTAKEKISYNTARQLLNDLNNEGSDFTFGEIEVDKYNKDFKEDGNIKTEVSVFMPDDRGYVSRELNIPIDKNETRASLEEKLRDWQSRHSSPDSFYDDDFEAPKEKKAPKPKKDEKDWLPKATEIKEQGTSNRKQVSDNIQAHILEHYGPDYTGDDSISAEQAFVDQMDAMSWLPNNWKRGEEIAKGGSYLVYNGDMADFLDSLKINPKGKKFSEDKAFNTYVSLVGRESAKLYDKIKKHQAETINNYKKRKGK